MKIKNKVKRILTSVAVIAALTVGTIGISLADQTAKSCCSYMKEDVCKYVQQQSKGDQDRQKGVEERFEKYKAAGGWGSPS